MADNAPGRQNPSSPFTQESGAEDHGSHSKRAPKRRKKDDADRVRVSRACDRCKRKKTRCSGKQPCTLCSHVGLACEFTAAYTRGRLPSVVPEENPRADPGTIQRNDLDTGLVVDAFGTDHLTRRPATVQDVTSNLHVNELLHSNQTAMGQTPPPIVDQVDSRLLSSRNSPEPSQTDLEGHYVGPSSGVSFLLRVQKKLHQKVSFSQNSSIFTFGDAPLPEFDPSFFVLPPKADAETLVARYFDYAVATHRFLHRPTVEAWLEEFYENLGTMRQKGGARGRTALLFMVFAQAKEHMPNSEGPYGADTSARYFQAADHQLSFETGEIRLTSVQARLCQCFYLLSRSRVNHCWSLFGTTAHLILAIGIHRKRRVEASNGVDLVELECRKRVFWCAYGLDNYLSAALGRPRTFHDEDIDQDLPTCVNDSDLTPQRIITSNSKAQSIMMAAIAHNTLSKIISHVLRDLYGIRPPSLPQRATLAVEYSEKLASWRKELSRFLNADGIDTSLLIPVFQRQRNVLNLAYYHALILVYRPFLLSNFASLNSQSRRSRGAPNAPNMERNVAACLDAAINITTIVNELTEGRQIFRAFWFTHYFAFCAMVVLYVYSIQQRHAPEDTYKTYFDAAARCQSQISSLAEKDSLAERYTVVLEELRLEALKQTQRPAGVPNPSLGLRLPTFSAPEAVMHEASSNVSNLVDQSGAQLPADMFSNSDATMFEAQTGTTPSSMMAELTSWGEFDSLVNAGTGGLEFLFTGEQPSWNAGMLNGVEGVVGPGPT